MDPEFIGLGFTADSSLSTFGNLGCLLEEHYVRAYSGRALRVDYYGSIGLHSAVSKGMKRKWCSVHENMSPEASSSDSKGSFETACPAHSSSKERKDEPSVDLNLDFSLRLGCVKSPSTKKVAAIAKSEPPSPLQDVDLELSISNCPSVSEITSVHQGSLVMNTGIEKTEIGGPQLDIVESAALSHDTAETFLPPFHETEKKEFGFLFKPIPRKVHLSSWSPYLSACTANAPGSSTTCTSGITRQQQPKLLNNSKFCKFTGCSKRARGSSRLCIAHGGGRRCQRPDCNKGAEGKTSLCKAHGGGRRCHFLGCTKSAEGRTDFCIAHGGGRRCHHESCTKAARGKSGLCIRHGGGKRCRNPSCTRSAEGVSGLCISHGGGRRCQYPACTKGAQGSTDLCKAHGGGKRCTFAGCTKGAEGSTPLCKGHGGGKRCSFQGCPKSVHGGTSFCVAHGGGKRCYVLECTKSARGRTNFCVRHGGGRRCKFEGCGKSAQGSTDFCKAHGGRKRCSVDDGVVIQDKRVHGGINMGSLVQIPISTTPGEIRDLLTEGYMNLDHEKFGRNEAVPAAYKVSDMNHGHFPPVGKSSCASSVPEDRVHGGGFLSMVTGGSALESG